MLDPVLKADQPQPVGLQGLLKDWGIDAGNDIVLDVSGMGRLIGTDESVPVAASYPPHPITENFNLLTAYPLARSMTPVEGGVNGRTAQTARRDQPEQLGGNQPQEPHRRAARQDWTSDDKKGPVSLGAAVSAAASVDAAAAEGARRRKATTRNRPRRGSSRSAIRISRATPRSASRATAICS